MIVGCCLSCSALLSTIWSRKSRPSNDNNQFDHDIIINYHPLGFYQPSLLTIIHCYQPINHHMINHQPFIHQAPHGCAKRQRQAPPVGPSGNGSVGSSDLTKESEGVLLYRGAEHIWGSACHQGTTTGFGLRPTNDKQCKSYTRVRPAIANDAKVLRGL